MPPVCPFACRHSQSHIACATCLARVISRGRPPSVHVRSRSQLRGLFCEVVHRWTGAASAAVPSDGASQTALRWPKEVQRRTGVAPATVPFADALDGIPNCRQWQTSGLAPVPATDLKAVVYSLVARRAQVLFCHRAPRPLPQRMRKEGPPPPCCSARRLRHGAPKTSL
jgi:hypothetical protein